MSDLMTFPGDRPLAAWLAMCFGLCMQPSSTAVPNKNPRGKAEPKRRTPTTDWRDMPLMSKYDLVKQIGKGGFSEIWLAQRRDGGGGGGGGGGSPPDAVALKVVKLADPDLEAEEVATLLAEAKFLRTLDCPYLLHCHEVAATDEWLILVLEHLSGGELLDHLHKVKKYTEVEAAKLFAQIVSAISYLHTLNLIHRDIKPENVMFTSPVEECEAAGRPLRVKVIDLGMATLYDPNKPVRGCIGTPGFVPPELWHDGPHTPACDIYSLGVVLFIMLTGRKPHAGADIRMMTYCNKSIREAPGLSDERFLSLSAAARELVLAMLADDPRVRPTCAEVLRHPFITAVDSNAEAHREMSAEVRRKMRELAQLRRVHGLRYALRVPKPPGADHLTFLQALDQRRLRHRGENGNFVRPSEVNGQAYGRPSFADGAAGPFGRPSTADGGGGVPTFARSSLAVSYATPPPVIWMSAAPMPRPGASSDASTAGATTATAAAAAAAPSPLQLGASARGGGVQHPPTKLPSLQPISEPAAGSMDPSAIPTLLDGRPPPPAPPPPPGPSGDSRCCSPDGHSHDLGLPVPDSLAARPPPAPAGGGGGGGGGDSVHGSAAASGQPSHACSRTQIAIDPMAIVNALPMLHHCPSADAVTLGRLQAAVFGGSDGDGDAPLDGGSPVERAVLAERALLSRCMSANPDTLELLGHRESLKQLLRGVATAVQPETPPELRASAATCPSQPPPQQQQQQEQQPQSQQTG